MNTASVLSVLFMCLIFTQESGLPAGAVVGGKNRCETKEQQALYLITTALSVSPFLSVPPQRTSRT